MDREQIQGSFKTLGLEPGATFVEVKEAYRFYVQTFHEDKYPAGSPYQEKAHQKMVEINAAYENLKKFFQENPSGEFPGGWSTDPKNQTDFRSGDNGEMDWQNWQRAQEDSWNTELKSWYEADLARRNQAKTDEEKTRRRTIANTTRVGLIIAFLYLVFGHVTDHNVRAYANDMNSSYVRDKLQYDLSTDGTAQGAYALSRDQIYRQDQPLIDEQDARSQQENNNNGSSGFFLLLFGGGLSWLLFSKKGKAVVANYIEGKSSNHAFAGR